jgi:parvulin-like peptidyl-prolyl isomerase
MRRYTSRRKKALRNLAIVTIIFAIVFLAIKLFNLKSKQDDVIVAQIGKEKIYKSEIEKKLQNIFADEQQLIAVPSLENLPREVIEIVVKEIYSDRQILKLAKKEGFDKDAKIQEKIQNFQEKTLRQAYIDSIVEKEITKEKISEKYAEITNSLSGKKEYQIAHILLKSKEEAEKLALELNSKKAPKFSDLAKKHSLEQQSALNGGDLGFILEDNITKEIADELINLKKDEVTQPIQTKLGWHLVKLLDSRDAKTFSFEESKEKIREQLIQNKINELNSSFSNGNEVKFLISFDKDSTSKTTEQKNKTDESKTQEASENSESKSSSANPEVVNEAKDSSVDEKSSNNSEISQDKAVINKNTSKLLPENNQENKVDDQQDETKLNDKDDKSANEKNSQKIKGEEKKSADKNSSKVKADKKNTDQVTESKAKEDKKSAKSKNKN